MLFISIRKWLTAMSINAKSATSAMCSGTIGREKSSTANMTEGDSNDQSDERQN